MADDDSTNGHHFGNFKNYYNFHPINERTSRFPTGLFRSIWNCHGKPQKFFILDIGCNEGNLSMELLQLAQKELIEIECFLLGVDLDTELIRRANEKFETNPWCQFSVYNIMKNYSDSCLAEKSYTSNDVVDVINSYIKKHEIMHFSLVTCFSITMWIHMNYGDDGLHFFLDSAVSFTGGSLLLEPQPWKCYRNAMQRCRRLSIPELPHYQDLSIREMKSFAKSFVPALGLPCINILEGKEWGRELLFFHKRSLPQMEELFNSMTSASSLYIPTEESDSTVMKSADYNDNDLTIR